MAEQIPEAELAVIEGAGHLSNLERPGEFSELLVTHAERCGIA
jgi:pimeloyl-ACP methyl ester carboxylesterase